MSFIKATSSQQSYNGGSVFTLNKYNYNYGTSPVAVSGLLNSLTVYVNRFQPTGSGV